MAGVRNQGRHRYTVVVEPIDGIRVPVRANSESEAHDRALAEVGPEWRVTDVVLETPADETHEGGRNGQGGGCRGE